MSLPLLARSGLSLDRLASFVAIADAGGLSAAARGDAVRQSQMSRQLKELETFFGTALIERRRGVFRLTPTGRDLVQIVRPALAGLEDLGRRCGGEPLDVHLGAGESVLVWKLVPRLGGVLAADAAVRFTLHNLRTADILARLREGRLDLGIVRQSAVEDGLASVPAGEVRHALFVARPQGAGARSASPDAAPRGKVRRRAMAAGTMGAGSVDPEEVLGRAPVAVLEGNEAAGEAVESWAREAGVALRVGLRCTSLVQVAAAVEHLGMAAVLPVWAAAAFSADRVRQVPLAALAALRTPLRLVWSRRQAEVRPVLVPLARLLSSMLAGG